MEPMKLLNYRRVKLLMNHCKNWVKLYKKHKLFYWIICIPTKSLQFMNVENE